MEDHAIIIGLQNYPGLGQPALSGPENDANSFKEWILDANGGNVPSANVNTILSSDYPSVTGNPTNSVFKVKPAILDVIGAFEALRVKSLENQNRNLGPKVGNRLYIFMSGHGIAPTPYGNKIEKESGLLMSNVEPTNIAAPHFHLPGAYAATWFCENELFEEVFLFMDCCRDLTIVPGLNIFLPPKGNADKAKRFYAFATRWSRRARERTINGKVQGVFTKTLLMGLYGAAAEPDPNDSSNGVITGASLKSYLYQNMKEFIHPDYRNDPELQEPDVDYFPKANEGRDIVIKKVPIRRFPVKLKVPKTAKGDLIILYNGQTQVQKISINAAPTEFDIQLPRGKYLAIANIDNTAKPTLFDVRGIEETASEALVDLTV
jgi:hypothetical protein